MWKDSETKIDFLDFGYLKEILKEVVMDENLSPSTIGVYGDWGSGKSSLIEMVISELTAEEDILCIKFNGWLFEGYDDTKSSFMGIILDSIDNEKNICQKSKDKLINLYKNIDILKIASFTAKHGIDYFLTGGTGTFISLFGEQIKKKISGISETDINKILEETMNPKKLRQSILKFREEFSSLLDQIKLKRLVIFIDELDRCNSETILEVFEAMRLFLFTDKTSFIIGADERHIEFAVKQKFKEIEGNNINIGKEYLEKIIQYPIKIPQLNKKEMINYITYLFLSTALSPKDFQILLNLVKKENNNIDFEINKDFFENNKCSFDNTDIFISKIDESIYLAKILGPILARGLNGNPRHCKRFLNALSMRVKMAKFKNIKLNKAILGKLMILEYFNQSYFKKLPNFLDNDGKIKELELFEENIEIANKDLLNILKEYSEDSYFIEWAKLEPKIYNEDLRPYLYFTRDSLYNFKTINIKLSEVAKEILKNLFSNTNIKQKNALKKLNEINLSEADYIYNELEKSLFSDEKQINSNKFTLIIDFCKIRDEKRNNFLSILNELPSEKISFSIIPKIIDYFKKINTLQENIKLLDKWSTNNSKLKPFIEKQLKGEKYGDI